MKKKLLVGILVLTMLVACLGVSALAAAANSDITTADALADALGGINVDGVITINEAKEVEKELTIDGVTATIDLNGQTITTKDKAGLFNLVNNADITIMDSTDSAGTLKNDGVGQNVLTQANLSYNDIITGNSYKLTLQDGVKLVGGDTYALGQAMSSLIEGTSATINIDKAELSTTKGGYLVNLKNIVLNIKDGTFNGKFTGSAESGSITGGTFPLGTITVSYVGNIFDTTTSTVKVDHEENTDTVVAISDDTKEATLVASGSTYSGTVEFLVRIAATGTKYDGTITVLKNASLKFPDGTGSDEVLEARNNHTFTVNKDATLTVTATNAKVMAVTNDGDGTINSDGVVAAEGYNKSEGVSGGSFTIEKDGVVKVAKVTLRINGEEVVREVSQAALDQMLKSQTDSMSMVKIQLTADVELENTIKVYNNNKNADEADLTIDLNGKTLTYKGNGTPNCAILSEVGGRVDITNGEAATEGTIATNNNAMAISLGITDAGVPAKPVYNKNGEAVIGEKVKVTGTVGVFNEGSKLTVEGTIDVASGFAIAGNGTQDAETGESHGGTEVVIKDGAVVKSGDTAAVYQPQDGTLNVEGGEIEGAAGIVARAGSVTVEDGATVTATGKEELQVGDAGTKVPASAVVVDKTTGYGEEEAVPEVQINGGEFHAAEGQQTVTYTEDGAGETEGSEFEYAPSIEVSGGTFQSNGKADETVNQYTVAEKAINENTGTVYNYDNEIIAFGYGATRQEAIESAKTARKGTKGEPAATLWDTLDWIDQTFYIVFDEPVPAHKSIDVTVSFAIDGEDYTFTATCNGGDAGTSRMFAWSFLNNDQNTVVGPDGEETTISGTPTGNYTLTVDDSIDLNGHGTVAVEAEDIAIVLPALITTDTTEETLAKAMEVTTANSVAVGQYFEASFKTDKLPMTKPTDGTTTTTAYWLGWAMTAPTGATKYQYRLATSDTALATATWAESALDANITGANTETDKGIAVYYDVAKIDTAKTWLQVQFIDETGKQYGTYVVHVVMDEVTFAPPTGATDPVVTAKMANQDGSTDTLSTAYSIDDKASGWKEADGVYDVVIDATAVKPHYNAQGKLGYWVGFAAKAPEGATGFNWGEGKDLTKLTTSYTGETVEKGVYVLEDAEPADGVTYYLDAATLEDGSIYFMVEWTGASGTISTVTYCVSLEVTTEDPAVNAPEIYAAITGADHTTDPNKVAGTPYTVDDGNLELVENATFGYVWEVTLDPGKLTQTQKQGSGATAYYTGIALPAPDANAKVKYLFPDDIATGFTLEDLNKDTEKALEPNVYFDDETGKPGVAFYVTVDESTMALNKEWAAVQWVDEEGNVLGTYIIHMVLGDNVSLVVPGISDTSLTVDFVSGDANKAIDDAVKAAAAKVTDGDNTGYTVAPTDAIGDVLYAAFSAKIDDVATSGTPGVTFSVDGQNVFEETYESWTNRVAGAIYFNLSNAEQNEQSVAGGKYTVTLYVEKGATKKALETATFELYHVTYSAIADHAFVDGAVTSGYTLDPEAFTAPEVEDVPAGYEVKWTASTDDQYNITYTGTIVEQPSRPVGGGTSTTSKVTTPENGSVELSSTTARGGQTVTVTATPDEGYDVGEVIVKDRNGNPVEVTKNDDGTYSYTVPAGKTPVTVEVVFDECLCDDFADLDLDEWYHEAVDYAIKNELMLGQGDGWAPTDAVRSAEIFVILGRLDGAGLETGGDHWYDESLAWAMEKGYTDGSTPLANCSRERAVTLLWRYYGEQASDADITGFVDAADVSDWALDAMKWAVENEIIKGLDNNDIQPRKDLTRAEFATILERLEAAPATETAE